MRQTVLKKGYLDLALGTTLGKGLLGQKLINDRSHLELQGVSKKRMGTDIKNLLLEVNANLIGLQETMKKKYPDKFFRTIDPNNNFAWHWLPSNGRSGGILCGFKIEKFYIVKIVEHEFAMEAEVWDKEEKKHLRMVTIYGPAHEEKKE
jgi:hypothetical protein